MAELVTFPCGCSFEVLKKEAYPSCGPALKFDLENINMDCPAVWDLLARGLCKGVFQLESKLGIQWSKKLKPTQVEHLSALGAILRPGCLKNFDEDGVSTTQHYCRRKNNEEEVKPYHPIIDNILASSYNLMIYQEQSIKIATEAAGFNLVEADGLRKAMGKKDTQKMAEVEKLFIEKAKAYGVLNEEQAKQIIAGIKKSQRYNFNRSHSMSYGLTGYDCAYIKAHDPRMFYTAWLLNAKHKKSKKKHAKQGGPLEEIRELVEEAKLFNIFVEPPDLRSMKQDFHLDNGTIRFGFGNIKNIGVSQVKKLREACEQESRNIGDLTWFQFLTGLGDRLSSTIVTRLIAVGALSWFNLSRARMQEEYRIWNELGDSVKAWVQTQNFSSLAEALEKSKFKKKEGGPCHDIRQVNKVTSLLSILNNPPTQIDRDSPHWIQYKEQELLGIALTSVATDKCNPEDVNTTVKEAIDGKDGFMVFATEVVELRTFKTKKGKSAGKDMAYLTVKDKTGTMGDCVIFADLWDEVGNDVIEGQLIYFEGERSKNGGIIVKKLWI